MASVNEIQSLEEINYKSRLKFYFYPIIITFLFIFAFLNSYPIGQQLKLTLSNNLKGTACNPDFESISIEWLLPKLVIRDLVLPASCLNRVGEPLKFNYVNVNFHLISFSPFGIPFKIETEVSEQPISFYFIQGIGQRMVRIKDQTLKLERLKNILNSNFKLTGTVVLDLAALVGSNNTLKELSLKTQSKNLSIPSQNLEGFTTPNIKINDFYIEAHSDSSQKLSVDRFIIGDPSSPVRGNFKGAINLNNNIMFSTLNLGGEIFFSTNLKESIPLVELFFQNYTQKDGFYQIKLGGTLGQPQLLNL